MTISTNNMLLLMIAIICILLPGYSWFTFSTVSATWSSLWVYAYYGLTIFFLVLYLAINRVKLYAKNLLPTALFLLTILTWHLIAIDYIRFPRVRFLLLAVVIFLLLSLPSDAKKALLERIAICFALIMGFALIVYALRYSGLELPHVDVRTDHALKNARGLYYEICFNTAIVRGPGVFEFCGIYDEPGLVGTLAALVLAAYDSTRSSLRFSNGIKMTLLIICLASGSFAGYLLLAIYIVARFVVEPNRRNALFLFALIAIFIVLVFLPLETSRFVKLQQRILDLFVHGSFADNRTSALVENRLSMFYATNNMFELLFGHGFQALEEWGMQNNSGDASVKLYFYDYGIVGILGYYVTIIALGLCAKNGKPSRLIIPLMAAFLASTYQRPDIFNSLLVAIVILGCASVATVKEDGRNPEHRTSIRRALIASTGKPSSVSDEERSLF